MSAPAKLRAINLISSFFVGREMDRDPHSGNRVLRDAHGNHFEGMDDVLGTDVNDDRLVDHDMYLCLRLNIVLAVGIVGNNTEKVVVLYQLHVLFAKHPIFTGITNVPIELLSDDLD